MERPGTAGGARQEQAQRTLRPDERPWHSSTTTLHYSHDEEVGGGLVGGRLSVGVGAADGRHSLMSHDRGPSFPCPMPPPAPPTPASRAACTRSAHVVTPFVPSQEAMS